MTSVPEPSPIPVTAPSDTAGVGDQGPLGGLVVVLSGTVPAMSKPEAERAAAGWGAIVAGSVTAKTTLMVIGAGSGSKLRAAQAKALPVLPAELFATLTADAAGLALVARALAGEFASQVYGAPQPAGVEGAVSALRAPRVLDPHAAGESSCVRDGAWSVLFLCVCGQRSSAATRALAGALHGQHRQALGLELLAAP